MSLYISQIRRRSSADCLVTPNVQASGFDSCNLLSLPNHGDTQEVAEVKLYPAELAERAANVPILQDCGEMSL